MTSSAEIMVELQALGGIIARAQADLAADSLLDLSSLEDDIEDLCCRNAGRPAEDGRYVQPPLVAIIHDEVFLVTDDQIILLDMTAWGWVHLIVGSIALITGLALLSGQLWAVVLGVFLAMASAFTQILFITVFPLWSLAIIAIDILVIYGLVVHGEEAATAGGVQAGG